MALASCGNGGGTDPDDGKEPEVVFLDRIPNGVYEYYHASGTPITRTFRIAGDFFEFEDTQGISFRGTIAYNDDHILLTNMQHWQMYGHQFKVTEYEITDTYFHGLLVDGGSSAVFRGKYIKQENPPFVPIQLEGTWTKNVDTSIDYFVFDGSTCTKTSVYDDGSTYPSDRIVTYSFGPFFTENDGFLKCKTNLPEGAYLTENGQRHEGTVTEYYFHFTYEGDVVNFDYSIPHIFNQFGWGRNWKRQ